MGPFLFLLTEESMFIQLADINSVPMFFIAGQVLNPKNPGPVELDLSNLPLDQIKQVYYNLQRGIISSPDPTELNKYLITKTPVVAPPSIPTPTSPPRLESGAEDSVLHLKALLKESVKTIRVEYRKLSLGELNRLKKLEEEGKKRKSLLKEWTTILEDHQKSVLLMTKELGNPASDGEPVSKMDLYPLSDIVDSDEETITVKVGAVEEE